jgi:hypothetical protein
MTRFSMYSGSKTAVNKKPGRIAKMSDRKEFEFLSMRVDKSATVERLNAF